MELLKDFDLDIEYHECKPNVAADVLSHCNYMLQVFLMFEVIKDVLEKYKYKTCLVMIIITSSLGVLRVKSY